MIPFADLLLAFVFLSVMVSLASNRLMELVKIMAFQGVVVSILPMALEHGHGIEAASLEFLTVMLLIKGAAMPAALYIAVKKVANRREVEPYIGYNASIFSGLIIIMAASFISHRLSPYMPAANALLLPAGLTTIGAGFFLMMARHKAITQVIGYLMLENGIYLMGAILPHKTHSQYILEFGILLDLLAGVMIMGIILYHINKTFDDVDTGILGSLKD
ncbi:MAG: hydrogenase [Deltaproteobacteria bacterium]|nr:hydrogenase [Deltaproteobacteria bacterium]